jgi:hypothetical protein
MVEDQTQEAADKIVNKAIAREIARRTIEIRKLEAKIKIFKKEIEKIKNGELVPDLDEDDMSSHFTTYKAFKCDEGKSFNLYNNYKKLKKYDNISYGNGKSIL